MIKNQDVTPFAAIATSRVFRAACALAIGLITLCAAGTADAAWYGELPVSSSAGTGGGAPVNALGSAGTDGGETLLQFTSAGHVLGFRADGVIVASARHMVRIDFLDAGAVVPEADGEVSPESNTGTAAPLGRVTYRNIWDGVTAVYEASGGAIVKSTYYVDAGQAGSAVDQIRLQYARPVSVDAQGNLVIAYEDGTMTESAPVAWQDIDGHRTMVPVSYVLSGEDVVGFAVGAYDHRQPLVIDPALSWNTFLGTAAGEDRADAIAVDSSGNVYVTGTSGATWGTPVRAFSGSTNAFVAKLSSNGTLVWNTFLGAGTSGGYAIAVDSSANVFVGGFSDSTWGSPVRAYTIPYEAFVAKLNSSGVLQWNTFLGGNGSEQANGIAVDGSGNVYVAGFSDATWGSPVRAFTDWESGFAAKLNSSGVLQWNTFLGAGTSSASGIAVDASANVYVSGWSDTTWGSPVRAYSSGIDAYAAKLNSSGVLQWNTFLGGAGTDQGNGIAVDGSGNVFVAGYADTTWGSPVRAFSGTAAAMVAKVNSSGVLQWNTFLGGSVTAYGAGIVVDGSANVYVTGYSQATWGSPHRAFSAGYDAYAATLNSSGSLTWNTFLGGAGSDSGTGIAADGSGNVYVSGATDATWGSPVRSYGGLTDAFVAAAMTLPFSYRKSITVQASQVTSGPQTNFPFLFNTTDANLKTVANGGHVQNANGYDIIFRGTDDTTCGGAGTAPCTFAHEIEKYTATTGELVAWVKIPSINNGTVFYIYYGNASIGASTEQATSVWDANYKAVWHLKEASGNFSDSTSNGNTGTDYVSASAKTGQIGSGQNFDGANDYVSAADSASLDTAGSVTYSAWVYATTFSTMAPYLRGIISKYNTTIGPTFRLGDGTLANNKKPQFRVDAGGVGKAALSSVELAAGGWYYITGTYDGSNVRIYVNGVDRGSTAASGALTTNNDPVAIGAEWTVNMATEDREWNGYLDEARISGSARSAGWIATEYNNQSAPSSFYALGTEVGSPPTAVDLVSFKAPGSGPGVTVVWQTGQESGNRGFNLYRSEAAGGAYVKLNGGLIPGASLSGEGRRYEFGDAGAVRGRLYYYKLEDVDVSGSVKFHGPVCVDWDGDGLPDDWEIAHGLNPAVNDAALDSDGDGAPNWLEYQRGSDPFNRDTDGDGIRDGAEKKRPGYGGGSVDPGESVQVISSDGSGMTLELLTKSFDVTPVVVGGQAFERLRVPGYVHGFTQEVGSPQVPLKGILLDIPPGKQGRVEVLDSASRVLAGYRVYPAPLSRAGANRQVEEVFSWDEAAYQSNAYYPAVAAELSGEYVFRGQGKQRLIFYPLRFNPATGELLHSERIRVRVEFYTASGGEKFVSAHGAGKQMAASEGKIYSAAAEAAAVQRPLAAEAAGEGGYKVSTDGEGIYRISRDWLTAQGIGPTEMDAIDLSRVQLFHLGVEQALHVVDANRNNRLDSGDSITFYATAVPAAYAKYATYNVYWLIDAGRASPLRMASVNGAPAGAPVAVSHRSTVHHELDQAYYPPAVGADGMDRWIFSSIAKGSGFDGGGVAKNFSLSLPGALSTGDLTIRMYGPYDMEHETAVSFNGSSIGSATWSGISWTQKRFSDVRLLEANTVSLLCVGALDKTAVDWFEVVYERAFKAVSDSLKFSHPAGYRYQLSQFSSSQVEVYDITEPSGVQRVLDGASAGGAAYTIEVEPAGATGSRSYLAVGPAAVKSPAAIVRDRASGLAAASNAADWIMITHRSLGWDGSGAQQGWAARLVSLRQSQGLRTAVVDVEDIFDEFGYGLVSPQAIKEFIAYAYGSWQSPAPQYVLLMGDTSYDYKGNGDAGTVNHVPGYLIYTPHWGETISDEWYVQVSGADAVPDLYIGRLPAATLSQAEAMADKIVSYETAATTKGWEKRLVLVADNQSEEWEAVFETMNEEAAGLLPAGMSAERFYLQEYQNERLAVSDLSAELLSAIEAGALIVNYSGHGSVNIWAGERIIDNRGAGFRSDVGTLSNRGKYPFVVNMSCLTGYFIYPHTGYLASEEYRSLAEGWLWPAGAGAVAALMPTGMTGADGQQVLSKALYEGLFALDQRRLGPAVGYAKQQVLANGGAAYEEISNTFMFFGDPASSLKVPLPRRPTGLSAQWQAGGTVGLSWAAGLDCDGNAVAGYHLYRRRSTEDGYTRLNTAPIAGLRHTDAGLSAAPVGATYYYVLSAVDSGGDESVKSAPAALSIADSGGGDVGGGGGGGGGVGGGDGVGGGGVVTDVVAAEVVDGALSLLPAGASRRICSSRSRPWRC